jgi:selenocysteine lyase/cysteine desulfurase
VPVPSVPKSPHDIVRAFEQGLTSRTALILVSHVSFMNGQIFPVRDVCELGRKHGIPVVVDGAHAFAQFPFQRDDLTCDYYGTSLHKWITAPLGTGFLYVRKSKIGSVWSLMASGESQKDDIRKFEEIGTHPAANHNAISEAITFHELIGAERKAARFRYLRRRWTEKLDGLPNVHFSTNLAPEHSCAITLVGIDKITPGDLGAWLLSKHSTFVVGIVNDHLSGIRVTPNVYTTLQEVDRFANAMRIAATKGLV